MQLIAQGMMTMETKSGPYRINKSDSGNFVVVGHGESKEFDTKEEAKDYIISQGHELLNQIGLGHWVE